MVFTGEKNTLIILLCFYLRNSLNAGLLIEYFDFVVPKI